MEPNEKTDQVDTALYTCADGEKNCGRALGKYQFMPYNEYAAAPIQIKPNGRAFLQRVKTGNKPTEQELMQFFPPADQDQAFQRAIADKLTTSATEGDVRSRHLIWIASADDLRLESEFRRS